MGPVHLTTAALAVGGVTSAGGLTALVMKVRAKTATKSINRTTGSKGAQDGSSKNRVAR
jgi:hypothetical protein